MKRKLRREILCAAETMSTVEFYQFLCKTEDRGLISLYHDSVDYCVDFARRMVERMSNALKKGSWIGYEIEALKVLEDLPCIEDDLIIVNAYGFPKEIQDNNHLMQELGLQVA